MGCGPSAGTDALLRTFASKSSCGHLASLSMGKTEERTCRVTWWLHQVKPLEKLTDCLPPQLHLTHTWGSLASGLQLSRGCEAGSWWGPMRISLVTEVLSASHALTAHLDVFLE